MAAATSCSPNRPLCSSSNSTTVRKSRWPRKASRIRHASWLQRPARASRGSVSIDVGEAQFTDTLPLPPCQVTSLLCENTVENRLQVLSHRPSIPATLAAACPSRIPRSAQTPRQIAALRSSRSCLSGRAARGCPHDSSVHRPAAAEARTPRKMCQSGLRSISAKRCCCLADHGTQLFDGGQVAHAVDGKRGPMHSAGADPSKHRSE